VSDAARIQSERQSQRLVTAYIVSGMFFMLLPGTFLGVWNLLNISQAHLPSALPQAWLQAHGQAQIFGWIGSFILGIGFYSLTKMQSSRAFPSLAAWAAWVLWTLGVSLRWTTGIIHAYWRILLPLSGVLELAAFVLFYRSVRRHRTNSGNKPEAWMRLVGYSTIVFLLALTVNCWLLVGQALRGGSPALSHVPDQQFIVLAVWGVLVPTIWGFNARWLPIFAGLKQPDDWGLLSAYFLGLAGVAATFLSLLPIASVLFLAAAILSILALHVWEPAVNPPKLLNVHPSFAWFARLAYIWLLVSCALTLLAVRFDQSGGFWGASRHALTVGFVAGMVFTVGQRILPAFCGMRVLWSKKLMFWSLLLLFAGCALRVSFEPLAYENLWAPAWKVLPASAVLELLAVTLFALNISVTLLRPPAHLLVHLKPNLTSRGR
jgi:hypothetical protein